MAGLPLNPPPAIRAELQKIATANAFHALQAATELAKCVASLGPENVTVLKGVALSQRLYGTPNARHVGDLDLLATPASLIAQAVALAACGYTLIHPAARLTPRRARAFGRFWKDATFRHTPTGFELDLHWRLFNHSLHPANRLLQHTQREQLTVFNRQLSVLPAREQFLYACAHGVSDAFTYAKSLADVAAFLRLFSPAELDQALDHAERLGLLAHVSAAICLADSWLGTATTSPRLLPADAPLTCALLQTAFAGLRDHGFTPTRDTRTPLEWLRWERRLIPGLRAALERGRRFLWRPRPWSAIDLPDFLFWLYPAVGLVLRPSKPKQP